MEQTKNKKLTLTKETVRTLTPAEMKEVHGGFLTATPVGLTYNKSVTVTLTQRLPDRSYTGTLTTTGITDTLPNRPGNTDITIDG